MTFEDGYVRPYNTISQAGKDGFNMGHVSRALKNKYSANYKNSISSPFGGRVTVEYVGE